MTDTATTETKQAPAPEAVTTRQPVQSDQADFDAVTARWSGKAPEPAKPAKVSTEITERVRGADGKFAPAKAKPAAQAEDGADEPQEDGAAPTGEAAESDEEQPTPEAGDGGTPDKAAGAELEKALSALRLEGVPSEALDALGRTEAGRERLLKWASQAAKRQAKRDAEFRKRDEELKATKAKAEATPEAERKLTAPADLKPKVAAFVQKFGLDDEAGPALEELFVEAQQAPLSMAESIRAESAKGIETVQGVVLDLMFSEARRDLEERFPGLADRAAFRAVKEKAVQLASSGIYAESEDLAHDALRDAATIVLGSPRSQSNGAERSKRERGQATAPARAQGRRDETEKEFDERVYQEVRKRHG